MSAKKRSKIAEQEIKNASVDQVFQNLMIAADDQFKAGNYNSSIDTYKEARQRRPYNVHPKVKIQDLQALIDLENSMNGELANEQEEIVVSSLNVPAPEVTEDQIEEEVIIEDEQEEALIEQGLEEKPLLKDNPLAVNTSFSEAEVKRTQVVNEPLEIDTPIKTGTISAAEKNLPIERVEGLEIDKGSEQIESTIIFPQIEPIAIEDIPELEDGLSKDVYREANAVITEYTSVRNGKTDIYKKVYHQWGYIFYFKNGSAITERMWGEETALFY